MAIGAAAIEILDGPERLRLRGVAAAVMAGIAHARHTHLEELWVIAAMWFMAIGAVFHNRRVLPQKWTTALRVAAQAILVNSALNELAGIGRTVRIMATGTGYLAFAVRHMRRTLQLRAPHFMALQAHFGLRFLQPSVFSKGRVEAGIGGQRDAQLLLYLVAIHAGQAA
jgi:hypothetical protein